MSLCNSVAIVRGKGIPTKVITPNEYEDREEFMTRVVNMLCDPDWICHRNTLTIEFVFDE